MINEAEKNFKIKNLEKYIDDEKSDIKKGVIMSAASTVAIGIGALGCVLLGKELFASNVADVTTIETFLQQKYALAGFATSGAVGIFGTIVESPNIRYVIDALRNYKSLKRELNEVEETDGKGMGR